MQIDTKLLDRLYAKSEAERWGVSRERLAGALHWFWYFRGYLTEGRDLRVRASTRPGGSPGAPDRNEVRLRTGAEGDRVVVEWNTALAGPASAEPRPLVTCGPASTGPRPFARGGPASAGRPSAKVQL